MLCVASANVVALAQPQVLRYAIDDLYKGVTAAKLGRYALILFAIAVGAGLFKYAMRQTIIAISRRLEFDLRNELFAVLQTQSVSWFQRNRTGEIMSIATNDLSAVLGDADFLNAPVAVGDSVGLVWSEADVQPVSPSA